MAKTININPLDPKSISSAVKELKRYKNWIALKETELRMRLAELGADVARIQFSGATYDGVNDVTVRVDDTGSVAVIYAEGEAVAFIEFGSGAKYGYGHPKAEELGMGPGTYPDNSGHWDNEKGWWYEHDEHSYGNPPAMAMYNAAQRIREEISTIAKEVFST